MPEFNDLREALDWLVNQQWENLTKEQRKQLRNVKREINFGSISEKRIRETLLEFGELQTKVFFEIKS
ncbi:MAG: hypothetical protein MUE85_24975 [Microscillaceae bacterium]|jgi:hypothetical protein|nr:hypothetical protein [Microscillaceae bacterium]